MTIHSKLKFDLFFVTVLLHTCHFLARELQTMARGHQNVRDANIRDALKRQRTDAKATEALMRDDPPVERSGSEVAVERSGSEVAVERSGSEVVPTEDELAKHKWAVERNYLHAMCSNSTDNMSLFRVKTVGDLMFFMAYKLSKCLVDHHNARYALREEASKSKALATDLEHMRVMQKAMFAFRFESGREHNYFDVLLVPYMRDVLELFWQTMAIKLNGGKYEVGSRISLGGTGCSVQREGERACSVLWAGRGLALRRGKGGGLTLCGIRRGRARWTWRRTCARRRATSATLCSRGWTISS